MADMNDISALLAALKAREGAGGQPDDADPNAPDEDSPEDTAEDNAKIVQVLQTEYPQIYAKISQQVEAEDSGDDAAPPDDGMAGAPPDKMAGMMS